ncbi:MAG: hypothetical protein JXR19_05790 [Bacteroidia bacterium]
MLRKESGGMISKRIAQKIIKLTKNNISNADDVLSCLNRISTLFNKHPAGIFNRLYRMTTLCAINKIKLESSQNMAAMEEFIVLFAHRYFHNLRLFLKGAQSELHWEVYFNYAELAEPKMDRLILYGINAHVTVDIPLTIKTMKLNEGLAKEWLEIGEELSGITSDFITESKSAYGLNSSSAFGIPAWVHPKHYNLLSKSLIRTVLQYYRKRAYSSANRVSSIKQLLPLYSFRKLLIDGYSSVTFAPRLQNAV